MYLSRVLSSCLCFQCDLIYRSIFFSLLELIVTTLFAFVRLCHRSVFFDYFIGQCFVRKLFYVTKWFLARWWRSFYRTSHALILNRILSAFIRLLVCEPYVTFSSNAEYRQWLRYGLSWMALLEIARPLSRTLVYMSPGSCCMCGLPVRDHAKHLCTEKTKSLVSPKSPIKPVIESQVNEWYLVYILSGFNHCVCLLSIAKS